MRESINGAWFFGIVITFMAIFIAFITISINYSKTYEMKTKMVTILEQYDGLNPLSVQKLNKLSETYGYRKKNTCRFDSGEDVVGILDGVPQLNPVEPQQICVTRELKTGEDLNEDKYYYNIEVFFGFDLPLLGDIFTFRVSGETNAINYPDTTDYFGV